MAKDHSRRGAPMAHGARTLLQTRLGGRSGRAACWGGAHAPFFQRVRECVKWARGDASSSRWQPALLGNGETNGQAATD